MAKRVGFANVFGHSRIVLANLDHRRFGAQAEDAPGVFSQTKKRDADRR